MKCGEVRGPYVISPRMHYNGMPFRQGGKLMIKTTAFVRLSEEYVTLRDERRPRKCQLPGVVPFHTSFSSTRETTQT